MKIKLTSKVDGSVLYADSDDIKIIEPNAAGGTKLVFGADMVRVVNEDSDAITKVVGFVNVPV